MKGISSNPALDAYQRMSVQKVGSTPTVERPQGSIQGKGAEAAQVSISSEARKLAASSPEVDVQKVEALKARLAAGTFKINPEEIAARLVATSG